MLKNQPDWFRQYGLDNGVVASALSYPALSLPEVKTLRLTGVPAVMLEFRGVLDEMEAALHSMPERRANEPIIPSAAWSRKQFMAWQTQVMLRPSAGNSGDHLPHARIVPLLPPARAWKLGHSDPP